MSYQLALGLVFAAKVGLDWVAGNAMFQPTRHLSTDIKESKHVKPFWINDTKLGIKLHCVLFNATKEPSWDDKSGLTILSHGNAGCIADVIEMPFLRQLGTVLVYDYRGYGASPGAPTEQSIKQDALVVLSFARTKVADPSTQISLYGFSLGCVPTAALCDQKVAKIILHAPFFSAPTIIGHHSHPLLGMCSPFSMDNGTSVCKTRQHPNTKIFVFHSPRDEIVPDKHGKALAAKSGGTFIQIGGTHNDPILTKKALAVLTDN